MQGEFQVVSGVKFARCEPEGPPGRAVEASGSGCFPRHRGARQFPQLPHRPLTDVLSAADQFPGHGQAMKAGFPGPEGGFGLSLQPGHPSKQNAAAIRCGEGLGRVEVKPFVQPLPAGVQIHGAGGIGPVVQHPPHREGIPAGVGGVVPVLGAVEQHRRALQLEKVRALHHLVLLG